MAKGKIVLKMGLKRWATPFAYIAALTGCKWFLCRRMFNIEVVTE